MFRKHTRGDLKSKLQLCLGSATFLVGWCGGFLRVGFPGVFRWEWPALRFLRRGRRVGEGADGAGRSGCGG